MKLLFLDIDGVLNDHAKLESGYCGIRHDKASLLNRILDAVPDVQLVISSAWRYLTVRSLIGLSEMEVWQIWGVGRDGAAAILRAIRGIPAP